MRSRLGELRKCFEHPLRASFRLLARPISPSERVDCRVAARSRRGYKTTVKTANATTMPVAMMPILRISKGKVRA